MKETDFITQQASYAKIERELTAIVNKANVESHTQKAMFKNILEALNEKKREKEKERQRRSPSQCIDISSTNISMAYPFS